MKSIKIKTPDVQQIYGVWHYCSVCGSAFTHSQGTFDKLAEQITRKTGHVCRNHLIDVSTETLEIEAIVEV